MRSVLEVCLWKWTDNEAYLLNLMQRSLRESNCRGFHWRNISENRPQAKGVERAVGIMKEGLFTNWLALEAHLGMRLGITSDGVSGGVHL